MFRDELLPKKESHRLNSQYLSTKSRHSADFLYTYKCVYRVSQFETGLSQHNSTPSLRSTNDTLTGKINIIHMGGSYAEAEGTRSDVGMRKTKRKKLNDL